MNIAKRLLKAEGIFDEKRNLQLCLQRPEARMSLMKAVVRPSATYLETAACYDTLKLAGGTASEGCARVLLDRNVDAKLANADVKQAIGIMGGKRRSSPHGARRLAPGNVAEAQVAIATKVVQVVCKSKPVGPLETAHKEAADAVVYLEHTLGVASFPAELQEQIEI